MKGLIKKLYADLQNEGFERSDYIRTGVVVTLLVMVAILAGA